MLLILGARWYTQVVAFQVEPFELVPGMDRGLNGYIRAYEKGDVS